jgi:hypothetical protein
MKITQKTILRFLFLFSLPPYYSSSEACSASLWQKLILKIRNTETSTLLLHVIQTPGCYNAMKINNVLTHTTVHTGCERVIHLLTLCPHLHSECLKEDHMDH